MTALKWFSSLNNNPIVRAELLHHERANVPRRRWQRWLIRGLYLLALEIGMIYFWGEFVGTITGRSFIPFYDNPILTRLGIFMDSFAILAHAFIMLRTLIIASNSNVLERQSETWETLILTGMTPRQLVLGKWWTTLRIMGKSYLALAILHGVLAVYLGGSTRIYVCCGVWYAMALPTPVGILLAALLAMLFTLLAAGLTAAIGVLAAVLARRRSAALAYSLILAVVLLIAVSGGFVFASRVHNLSCQQLNNLGPDTAFQQCMDLSDALLDTGVGAADNGSSLAASLAEFHLLEPDIDYFRGITHSYSSLSAAILPFITVPAFYLLATGGILGLAQRRVRRQGMLPKTA